MLAEGLPVPFRLRPDMIREDDTPQHRAVREALTNALVHADYFGKAGVVAIRRKNSIEVSNPGLLRISRELIEAGGISEARNETMLRIFSLVDIGERAGSGYDVLREGTYSAGKPDPVYTEIYDPERVKLTMELETSGLVEFRLPGMGGESSPLVTRVRPPRRDDENGETSDDPVTQSGDPVTQSGDPVTQSGDPVARLLAALGDDDLSTSELMQRLGLEHKTYFRRTYLSPALDRGLIERAIPDKPNSRLQKYRKARR
ncbi:MAG: ATP-binding protein [Atopobiaceae bacterium]|nr:ATP-binding protein [Atopobiaceae bacterium]